MLYKVDQYRALPQIMTAHNELWNISKNNYKKMDTQFYFTAEESNRLSVHLAERTVLS